LLFLTLALIAHELKDRLLEGDLLLGYLIGYPLGRFFIEYLRPDAWMIGPIAAAQLFAVFAVIGGTAVLVIRHVRAKAKSVEPVETAPEEAPESQTAPSSETKA
jgi:phosphatidylglycerol:prolipoprotein diacylglycerol transferase